MKKNKVKHLWEQGKPAVMGWCSTGNPYIAELMAHADYDAILIDWQHGIGVTQSSVLACLQAIGNTDTTPIVRVPWNEPMYIQYALDAGAYGVLVPMVNNADDAAKAGQACRYAPDGVRSVGFNRPALTDGLSEYISQANKEIICLVMIETREALDQVESIAKAPQIDGLYIGPSDLSLDLGTALSGWDSDVQHIEANRLVVKAAQSAGIIPCHHGAGPTDGVRLIKEGFKLCQIGSDVRILSAAMNSGLTAFKDALKEMP